MAELTSKVDTARKIVRFKNEEKFTVLFGELNDVDMDRSQKEVDAESQHVVAL
jgi:hypothetical protein